MAQTSKKLFGIKNEYLSSKNRKLDINSEEELLLLSAPSEYDDLYRKLGVNSKKDYVAEELKDSREIEVFQKKYNNLESFKGYHIKKLCNKYDLMLMPVSEIEGYLNDDAMKAIKEFSDNFKNITLSDSYLHILAGRECFYSSFRGKEIKTFIIFYKNESDRRGYRRAYENDVVTQIYSSGEDFSAFRVFNQFFLKKSVNGEKTARVITNSVISLLLILAVGFSITGWFILSCVVFSVYLYTMWYFNTRSAESIAYKERWNKYRWDD